MHEGKEIPSYRGDILNSYHPDDRRIDPDRLVQVSIPICDLLRALLPLSCTDLVEPSGNGMLMCFCRPTSTPQQL